MSVNVTSPTMVWAAAGSADKRFHALSGWIDAADLDKIRLTLSMANREGNLKIQAAVRYCWDPTNNAIYGDDPPDYAVPVELGPSADADGTVVDTTAVSLPSTDRAGKVQFGVVAWNDDTPYDDLSVAYAQLLVEVLAR